MKSSASTISTTTTTRTSSARGSPSCEREPKFRFVKMDLADKGGMKALFAREKFPRVIHLAAQAGVRYSLENPQAYVDSNVTGTLNVLEGCRHNDAEHLVFASTSSVYGLNTNMPFTPHRGVDHPLSLYATTKRANELMAHNYAALFKLPVTGLRFFTVYGPWGRPDMALFLFTQEHPRRQAHRRVQPRPPQARLHLRGGHRRGRGARLRSHRRAECRLVAAISRIPATSSAPFRLYNIGNNAPVDLSRYIEVLEDCLGKKAVKNMLPLQPGDVPDTFADVDDLVRDVGYKPATPVEVGIRRFVDWYLEYYKTSAPQPTRVTNLG